MGQEIPGRQNGQVLPVTLFFLLNVRVRESVMCPRQLARVPRSWRAGRTGGAGAEGRTESVAEIQERE